MKHILILITLILFSTVIHAQVGINNVDPKASLDITATNQANPSNTDGLLIPRIDDFPASNPAAAQQGMMVYLTTTSGGNPPGFYYWDNGSTTWTSVVGGTVQKINDLSDGKSDNDGTQNGSSIFLGVNSGLNDDSSANENVGIGFQSLQYNTTGDYNTATGSRSLFFNTTGFQNTANGMRSLFSNTTGYYNTANGYQSLTSNTTGFQNTANGHQSLNSNTTGFKNTAIGYGSGYLNTIGSFNVFIGVQSGFNETGSNKLYVENSNANADNALIYGEFDNNILRTNSEFQIGNPTGTGYAFPTADGSANQLLVTDGSGQISFETRAIGAEKLDDLIDSKSDSDGTNNYSSIFLGLAAGSSDDSSDNRGVGIGYSALAANTTGYYNSAFGYFSLNSNSNGDYNTAIGNLSLNSLTSGSSNTALGVLSGSTNLTGSGNIFVGYQSGLNELGSNTLYIENSNANSSNALIYGEFDTNILRVNGELQIGGAAGISYAFPTTDGTANQVMETDGSGNLSWASSSSLGTDDQNISGSGLSGTDLTIGIENGTSEVIDLSPLQGENTLDQAYDEGGAGIGGTITADSGAVNINGVDGFQVTGTFGSGATISLSGSDTRMIFNPRKGAFRTGRITASQWNDVNLGSYSFASGFNTTASGDNSTAMGYGSTASSTNSTALGYYATASGVDAIALGGNTIASNTFSTAMGSGTNASGNTSTAMGGGTIASGLRSTAIGSNTTASGNVSLATGNSTTASGNFSTAMGAYTTASGLRSTAIGYYSTSPSYAETTLGIYSTTYSPLSSSSFNNSDRLFSIGNGPDSANRSNALTIYKNGLMNINDSYSMPLTDGTANQIMATDGAGQIAFINGSLLGTDDQNITSATLTGSTLAIAIENGSGTTVDLSPLQDADWYETGGTPPNSINDNIYTQGKVGINNPSPSSSLDIITTSSNLIGQLSITESLANYGSRLFFKNSVETTNKWTLYTRADNTVSNSRFNFHHTTTGNVLQILGNGKVGIMRSPTTNAFEVQGNASKSTAGSWLGNSDRRLKTDIKTIEGKTALDKIMKMKGITYLWNDNKTGIKRPTEIQYGFIAQDLMQVFPEKVSKDALGYYQTAYGDYDPIFVEAIKELKNEIGQLSSENKKLKQQLSKYEQLEARLSALESKTNRTATDLVVIK